MAKKYRKRGTGHISSDGYLTIKHNGIYKFEHVVVAEKALGKPLPKGAVVHHVDYDRRNNANSNLVICQDNTYHKLLHTRQEAFNACGDANYRRCGLCGKHDSPSNMKSWINRGRSIYWHLECKRNYDKSRNQSRKAQDCCQMADAMMKERAK